MLDCVSILDVCEPWRALSQHVRVRVRLRRFGAPSVGAAPWQEHSRKHLLRPIPASVYARMPGSRCANQGANKEKLNVAGLRHLMAPWLQEVPQGSGSRSASDAPPRCGGAETRSKQRRRRSATPFAFGSVRANKATVKVQVSPAMEKPFLEN